MIDNICKAKTKGTGEPCTRPAGWGTDHPGVGKCKLHGGATPIKHGLYSKYTNHRLADMIEKLSEDEDLLNLRKTIAFQQSLILDILNRLDDGNLEMDQGIINTLSSLADKLGRNIERRQKVEEGEKYILQIEEVQRIIEQVVIIIKEEISEIDVINNIAERLEGLRI